MSEGSRAELNLTPEERETLVEFKGVKEPEFGNIELTEEEIEEINWRID